MFVSRAAMAVFCGAMLAFRLAATGAPVDPVLWLDMEGGSSVILESVNGTVIQFAEEQFGQGREDGRALRFGGDNEAVGVPWKDGFSEQGSVLLWLKPTGQSGNVLALSAGGIHFANNHLSVSYDAATESLVVENRWKGEPFPYHWRGSTLPGSVPVGKWTQVALVQDGKQPVIYLNGKQAAEITEGNNLGSWTDLEGVSAYQRSRWLLGGDRTPSKQGFSGLIDDLLITNEVLDENTIQRAFAGDNITTLEATGLGELSRLDGGERAQVSLLGRWDFAFVPPGVDEVHPPTDWSPIYLDGERLYAKPWWRYGVELGDLKARDIDTVWYRKELAIPEDLPPDRRLFLHFDAVAFVSDVYLNGEHLGRNIDGFLPFEFDITDKVKPGQDNELLLRVGSYRKAQELGAPIGAMFDQHGGIWQPAYLETRGTAYVDSVFVQPSVREKQLTVDVEVAGTAKDVAGIRLSILDEGQVLDSADFPAVDEAAIRLTIPWENPELWWPEHPKLYQVRVELLDENGRTLDRTDTTFGFREVWIDGNSFYLNGKKIHLYGRWGHTGQYYAARHYEGGYLAPEELWTAHKEAGIETVRLHCQPLPEVFLDEADRQGFLLIPETALNHRPISPAAVEHAVRLIERDRNHPSVVMWSGSNEFEHWKVPRSEVTSRFLALVRDTMREADPTRPVSHSAYGPTDGRDDVINYHYPERMRPYVNNWPNELFWPLDASVCVKRETTGNYLTDKDRNKPIMIGEMLPPWRLDYAEGYGQDYFTLTPDEREELDLEQKPFWFSRALILYRMLNILHVGQSIGGSGYVDNPMKKEMARLAYAPLVGMFYPWTQNVWSDAPIETELWLSNDDLEDFNGTLSWQLVEADGSVLARGEQPLAIEQGGTEKLPLSARVEMKPSSPGWQTARWEARLSGTLGDEEATLNVEQPLLIFDREVPLLNLGRRVLVWRGEDQEESSDALLNHLPYAVPVADVAVLAELDAEQTILILPGGIDTATQQDLAKPLAGFVQRGGRVLVLDQEGWADGWLPVDIRLTENPSNTLYPGTPGNKVFSGLPEAGLHYWQDDHRVVRRPLVATGAARSRPLVDFPVTGMVETFYGNGVYLFCQVLVQEKLDVDPMAARLLNALLVYLDTMTVPAQRATYLLCGSGSRFAAELSAAGIELAGKGIDLPDTAGRGAVEQILVDGSTVDIATLRPLKEWVRRGGRLILHNLSPGQITEAGKIYGFDLQAGKSAERITLLPDALNAGLSPYSVAFGQDNWPRANVPIIEESGAVTPATEPMLWGTARYGEGDIVFDQTQWEFENKDFEQARQFGKVFMTNLGVLAGSLPVTGGSEQHWKPVSLEKVYNAPLTTEFNKRNPDGKNIDAGKLLRGDWPRGRQTLDGVEFLMPDPVTESAPAIIRVNARRQDADGTWVETFPGGPSTVTVPVPRVNADELAFVQGYLRLWGEPYRPPQPGPLVMTYHVIYESGRQIDIPVYSGQQVRPIRASVQPLPMAELAFQSQETDGEDVGETSAYYLMRWRNPHPEEKIKAVEIEASEQSAHMPVVLAISYAESESGFD